MKKILSVLLVAVLALALTACGEKNEKKNSTPEEVVEKFISAFNEGNAKKILECVPDFMLNEIAGGFYNTAVSSATDVYEFERADWIFYIGFEIDDAKRLGYSLDSEIAEIKVDERSTNPDDMDIEVNISYQTLSKIEEACWVIVDFADGSDGAFNCVKHDGVWYIVCFDI